MIKVIVFDLARVLLFPKDTNYQGGLNDLYAKAKDKPDFKFFDYFVFNEELLTYIKAIKERIPVKIFTSDTIQKDPAIKEELLRIFENVYSAKEMGISKNEPDSYQFLAKELRVMPDQILYFDDSPKNIEAALLVGVDAVLYKDNSIKNNIAEVLQD